MNDSNNIEVMRENIRELSHQADAESSAIDDILNIIGSGTLPGGETSIISALTTLFARPSGGLVDYTEEMIFEGATPLDNLAYMLSDKIIIIKHVKGSPDAGSIAFVDENLYFAGGIKCTDGTSGFSILTTDDEMEIATDDDATYTIVIAFVGSNL